MLSDALEKCTPARVVDCMMLCTHTLIMVWLQQNVGDSLARLEDVQAAVCIGVLTLMPDLQVTSVPNSTTTQTGAKPVY